MINEIHHLNTMNKVQFQLIPNVFFIIALAILVALGTWQVKRFNWKTSLIETINSAIDQPPQPLPPMDTWKQLDLDQLNYRAVKATGRFNYKDEVHLFTHVPAGKATYSGVGYWVIVPFLLEDGGTVLVNRGFVPEKFKQQRTRLKSQVEGRQTITGFIKTDQGANYFTPETDYKNNIWYTRNIKAISDHLELENAAPFLIARSGDVNKDSLPQPREINVNLENRHLGYALTWYGLALTLIGVFVVFSFKSRKE